MLGKDLSQVLSDISDDKIEAAAKVTPKVRRHIWTRVVACAAVLALLIGAMFFGPSEDKMEDGQVVAVPGVLKVYACSIEDVKVNESQLEKYAISSENPIFVAQWNPLINASNFALPLTLQLSETYYDSAEITFKLSSEYGGFAKKPGNHNNYYNQITVSEGDLLYFGGNTLFEAVTDIGEGNSFFADILVYADGMLVGYGVISFAFQGVTCYAHGLTTVCYPPVDGQLQKISDEYIQERITEYKQQECKMEVR